MTDDTDTAPGFYDEDELILIDVGPEDNLVGKVPITPKQLLNLMISRQEHFGSPIPEGFVAPPGIDLDELLKQLPPPRPRG
jgi:hypothetical protein